MIGISCSVLTERIPKTITKDRYHLSVDYIESLAQLDEIGVILPITSPKYAEEVISRMDGLIISGGDDISPNVFANQKTLIDDSHGYFPERDRYELALCQAAIKQEKPILGICRGAQLLNVLMGGDLYQDIAGSTCLNHIQAESPEATPQAVHLVKNTRLYQIMQQENIKVNSFHHQAIKTLGKNVVAAAISDDQVIEGIEIPGDNFIVGVQWHPEILATHQNQAAKQLFAAFLAASRKKHHRLAI